MHLASKVCTSTLTNTSTYDQEDYTV